MDGSDVRMIQRGQNSGLALEAGEPLQVLCKYLRQNLNGHLPAQSLIEGAIDLTHPAFPELLDDLVATGQSRAVPEFCGRNSLC